VKFRENRASGFQNDRLSLSRIKDCVKIMNHYNDLDQGMKSVAGRGQPQHILLKIKISSEKP
jgi:hypothetical protein